MADMAQVNGKERRIFAAGASFGLNQIDAQGAVRFCSVGTVEKLVRTFESLMLRHSTSGSPKAREAFARVTDRNRLDISIIAGRQDIRDGDTLIVHNDDVFASGPLNKRITVVAPLFHDGAHERIANAGGRAIPIQNVQGFVGAEVLVGQ